jgi:SAM-dependent methyltransferase
MQFLAECLRAEDVQGKSVLEVGSYDVNGSPRRVVEPLLPSTYLGIDASAGPGVDRILRAEEVTTHLGENSFDVVISTELLEHVVDWRSVVRELKRAVKAAGVLVVTTRGPGFAYHPFPIDTWRYTCEDFQRIFCDMTLEALRPDPQAPGVLLKARKPLGFKECDLSSIEVTPMRGP